MPPLWFWDVYDAMKIGVPYYKADSIRQIPYYIRFRVRMVSEVMAEVAAIRAKRLKVTYVYDLAQ